MFELTLHPMFVEPALPLLNKQDDECVVTCPVTDLSPSLVDWLDVNPRDPKSTKIGEDIQDTLLNEPTMMRKYNQGIWISAESVKRGKDGSLLVALSKRDRHGVMNGGNTLASILSTIPLAEAKGIDLKKATVKVHLYVDLPVEKINEMSGPLNSNRMVTLESHMNQVEQFKPIKQAMRGQPGADCIEYYDGQYEPRPGIVPIKFVVQTLGLFNTIRFPATKIPDQYCRPGRSLLCYRDDMNGNPKLVSAMAEHLPMMLRLNNEIVKRLPDLWSRTGSSFAKDLNRPKPKTGKKARVVPLPFIDDSTTTGVDWGFVYAILTGFRAIVDLDPEANTFTWKADPMEVLDHCLPEMVVELKSKWRKIKGSVTNPLREIARENTDTMKLFYKIVEAQSNLIAV